LLSSATCAALPALRYSRRELAARLASIGGALIPVVLMITAPTAAAAATCITSSQCSSNPRAYVGQCCCTIRKTCTSSGKCTGSPC
jgi:hypothetical protein